MSPPAADDKMGASAASQKAKAQVFICKRLAALLNHVCSNCSAKNVKDIIRVVLPFVQGALEGIEEDQKVTWLIEKSSILGALFGAIVADEAMVVELEKEMFFKNLDTCLLLLQAAKTQFEDLKLKRVYELLVTVIPQLSDEGLSVMEFVIFDIEDSENGEMAHPIRQALVANLRRLYQEAWLKTLARIPSKKSLIKKTLTDLP